MLANCLAACAHLTTTVSEIQPDIGEKIVILSYPIAFDAPFRGVPVGLGISVPLWDGKTRMVSLPAGEKNSKIGCTVWPQCTRVTTNQPTNDVTTQPISISASFTNVK